ncbi:L-threonylcarbamoyladenylate synthase [Rickettsiales endosymbiont of Stachyamoeba lipophora]|uniref:L-threonylcarbamoyladenylate synthase n=1 Tax=Rickettsiales endosymbiont of Stachyamoeba lipophora TaxID=2486578 RepID=UPI000F647EE1|nr:L-threonylcarbamoyladenylate synthase [Rickettsiales endosymbiont of Stachyamoeba lipophora]AZL15628.1 threonylcarbamoyl-AMP synthase [Rickettsiales endosymbiont of Stachyamoeba lipophora]
MLKIIPENNHLAIKKTIEILNQGGLVCFPTETVYALACDINNQDAINKIYNLKKRDRNKPLAILCSDLKQAEPFVEINSIIKTLSKHFSPGPITYVTNLKPSMAEKLSFTTNNKIGFRIPQNEFALNLLRNFNNPLVATSANISGEKSSSNIYEITQYFREEADIKLIIDGGESTLGIPSTVLDVSSSVTLILREGIITAADIKKIIK